MVTDFVFVVAGLGISSLVWWLVEMCGYLPCVGGRGFSGGLIFSPSCLRVDFLFMVAAEVTATSCRICFVVGKSDFWLEGWLGFGFLVILAERLAFKITSLCRLPAGFCGPVYVLFWVFNQVF